MPMDFKDVKHARCSCGKVEMEVTGQPIMSGVCYCDDCQTGARQIEALPHAPRVVDPDGGTQCVLYRKDRVTCTKGRDLLKGYRITEKTATSRMVTTCCNSAMTMTFADSRHWVPVYRGRIVEAAQPLQMRICTKFKPMGVTLADDVPNYPGYPPILMWKLVKAWVPMLLGR
jgi:hypothetical protein